MRLGSGDLDALARQARAILDRAGFAEARIVASGGLDEIAVDALVRAGAPIDVFAVGSKIGVSADAPALDTAYKLVEYDGLPVMKLSTGKVTLPGPKQAFRRAGVDDVLGVRGEALPGEPDWRAARDRFASDLRWLPDSARRLSDPVVPEVRLSRRLGELAERVRAQLRTTGSP